MRHYVTYPQGKDDAAFHAHVSIPVEIESSETGENWITYNLTTPEALSKEDRQALAEGADDYKFNVKNNEWDNYQGL